MSAFTCELMLTELAIDWRQWRLECDFSYYLEENTDAIIVVPKGFITDGASVPRFLWWLLPSWGSYSRASVIHDYLCWRIRIGKPHPLCLSRKRADQIFREAMRVCKTGPTLRFLLYWGVRIGGNLPGKPNIVTEVNSVELVRTTEPH